MSEHRIRWVDPACDQIEHWIKSLLINWYVPAEGGWVCELYTNNGIDAGKWQRAKVKQLTTIDPATPDLEQLLERCVRKSFPNLPMALKFDITSERIDWSTPESLPILHLADTNIMLDEPAPLILDEAMKESHLQKYDSVSCFAGLEEAFRKEETAENLIANASALLKEGGYFFGIVSDSSMLFTKAHKPQTTKGVIQGEDHELRFPDPNVSEYFREYFQPVPISFKSLVIPNKESSLYLVHFPTLIKLCAKYNLSMLEIQNVGDFYEENRKMHEGSLKKILGNIKVHARDVLKLSLFAIFIFEKKEAVFYEDHL